MILCDQDIKELVDKGLLICENFAEASLQPASYDMRLGNRVLLSSTKEEIELTSQAIKQVKLGPCEFGLATSREKFKMPMDMVGHIGGKSQLGRRGLMLLAGVQIDPGFEGHLVIGLYNASPKNLYLDYEEPFATVDFHKLSKPVDTGFLTALEFREGKIPKVDKDYLRELETKSLTEIQSDMRKMTESVTLLATQVKLVFWVLGVIFAAVVGFGLSALLVH